VIVALLDARRHVDAPGPHVADRTRGAPTFAPEGLYFTGADYDVRFGLPPTRRDVTIAGG
jgi:hypothetical protein